MKWRIEWKEGVKKIRRSTVVESETVADAIEKAFSFSNVEMCSWGSALVGVSKVLTIDAHDMFFKCPSQLEDGQAYNGWVLLDRELTRGFNRVNWPPRKWCMWE